MQDKPEILSINDILDAEADPDDFIFVINAEGELKFVFVPGDTENQDQQVPQSALAILKLFGIDGFDENRVLH